MDEHYIEFTAVIGPIDEPHKLHTFDADGSPRNTVHGDLSDRLASAVWEVDHDADVSAHVTTETEMQARSDAVAERDRMRDELEAGLAQWVKEAKHAASRIGKCNRERDRLRAVVNVVRRYVPLIEAPVAAVDPQERLAVHLELLRRLRELDGSTEPIDG
jgi:hypothetical protein